MTPEEERRRRLEEIRRAQGAPVQPTQSTVPDVPGESVEQRRLRESLRSQGINPNSYLSRGQAQREERKQTRLDSGVNADIARMRAGQTPTGEWADKLRENQDQLERTLQNIAMSDLSDEEKNRLIGIGTKRQDKFWLWGALEWFDRWSGDAAVRALFSQGEKLLDPDEDPSWDSFYNEWQNNVSWTEILAEYDLPNWLTRGGIDAVLNLFGEDLIPDGKNEGPGGLINQQSIAALGLDIITSPTTFATGGSKAVAQFAGQGAQRLTRGLTQAARLANEAGDYAKTARAAQLATRTAEVGFGGLSQAERRLATDLLRESGELTAKQTLQGGIYLRLPGREGMYVPGTRALAAATYRPAAMAINSLRTSRAGRTASKPFATVQRQILAAIKSGDQGKVGQSIEALAARSLAEAESAHWFVEGDQILNSLIRRAKKQKVDPEEISYFLEDANSANAMNLAARYQVDPKVRELLDDIVDFQRRHWLERFNRMAGYEAIPELENYVPTIMASEFMDKIFGKARGIGSEFSRAGFQQRTQFRVGEKYLGIDIVPANMHPRGLSPKQQGQEILRQYWGDDFVGPLYDRNWFKAAKSRQFVARYRLRGELTARYLKERGVAWTPQQAERIFGAPLTNMKSAMARYGLRKMTEPAMAARAQAVRAGAMAETAGTRIVQDMRALEEVVSNGGAVRNLQPRVVETGQRIAVRDQAIRKLIGRRRQIAKRVEQMERKLSTQVFRMTERMRKGGAATEAEQRAAATLSAWHMGFEPDDIAKLYDEWAEVDAEVGRYLAEVDLDADDLEKMQKPLTSLLTLQSDRLDVVNEALAKPRVDFSNENLMRLQALEAEKIELEESLEVLLQIQRNTTDLNGSSRQLTRLRDGLDEEQAFNQARSKILEDSKLSAAQKRERVRELHKNAPITARHGLFSRAIDRLIEMAPDGVAKAANNEPALFVRRPMGMEAARARAGQVDLPRGALHGAPGRETSVDRLGLQFDFAPDVPASSVGDAVDAARVNIKLKNPRMFIGVENPERVLDAEMFLNAVDAKLIDLSKLPKLRVAEKQFVEEVNAVVARHAGALEEGPDGVMRFVDDLDETLGRLADGDTPNPVAKLFVDRASERMAQSGGVAMDTTKMRRDLDALEGEIANKLDDLEGQYTQRAAGQPKVTIRISTQIWSDFESRLLDELADIGTAETVKVNKNNTVVIEADRAIADEFLADLEYQVGNINDKYFDAGKNEAEAYKRALSSLKKQLAKIDEAAPPATAAPSPAAAEVADAVPTGAFPDPQVARLETPYQEARTAREAAKVLEDELRQLDESEKALLDSLRDAKAAKDIPLQRANDDIAAGTAEAVTDFEAAFATSGSKAKAPRKLVAEHRLASKGMLEPDDIEAVRSTYGELSPKYVYDMDERPGLMFGLEDESLPGRWWTDSHRLLSQEAVNPKTGFKIPPTPDGPIVLDDIFSDKTMKLIRQLPGFKESVATRQEAKNLFAKLATSAYESTAKEGRAAAGEIGGWVRALDANQPRFARFLPKTADGIELKPAVLFYQDLNAESPALLLAGQGPDGVFTVAVNPNYYADLAPSVRIVADPAGTTSTPLSLAIGDRVVGVLMPLRDPRSVESALASQVETASAAFSKKAGDYADSILRSWTNYEAKLRTNPAKPPKAPTVSKEVAEQLRAAADKAASARQPLTNQEAVEALNAAEAAARAAGIDTTKPFTAGSRPRSDAAVELGKRWQQADLEAGRVEQQFRYAQNEVIRELMEGTPLKKRYEVYIRQQSQGQIDDAVERADKMERFIQQAPKMSKTQVLGSLPGELTGIRQKNQAIAKAKEILPELRSRANGLKTAEGRKALDAEMRMRFDEMYWLDWEISRVTPEGDEAIKDLMIQIRSRVEPQEAAQAAPAPTAPPAAAPTAPPVAAVGTTQSSPSGIVVPSGDDIIEPFVEGSQGLPSTITNSVEDLIQRADDPLPTPLDFARNIPGGATDEQAEEIVRLISLPLEDLKAGQQGVDERLLKHAIFYKEQVVRLDSWLDTLRQVDDVNAQAAKVLHKKILHDRDMVTAGPTVKGDGRDLMQKHEVGWQKDAYGVNSLQATKNAIVTAIAQHISKNMRYGVAPTDVDGVSYLLNRLLRMRGQPATETGTGVSSARSATAVATDPDALGAIQRFRTAGQIDTPDPELAASLQAIQQRIALADELRGGLNSVAAPRRSAAFGLIDELVNPAVRSMARADGEEYLARLGRDGAWLKKLKHKPEDVAESYKGFLKSKGYDGVLSDDASFRRAIVLDQSQVRPADKASRLMLQLDELQAGIRMSIRDDQEKLVNLGNKAFGFRIERQTMSKADAQATAADNLARLRELELSDLNRGEATLRTRAKRAFEQADDAELEGDDNLAMALRLEGQANAAEADQLAAGIGDDAGVLLSGKMAEVPGLAERIARFNGMSLKNLDANTVAEDWVVEMLTVGERLTIPGEVKGFLKTWDYLTNTLFKSYAIMTFGFHVRNLFGGVMNNWLGGVNVDSYRVFLRAEKSYFNTLRKTGNVDQALRAVDKAVGKDGGEAYRLWHQMEASSGMGIVGSFSEDVGRGVGVLSDQVNQGGVSRFGAFRASIQNDRLGRERALNPLVGLQDNALVRGNAYLGQRVERFLRGSMAFDTFYKKGGDFTDAMLRVRKYHFDYQDLSNFERGFLRRVIPFYVWVSRNIPLQIEGLVTRPKVALTYWRVKQWLEQQSEEEAITPYFYGREGAIRLPFTDANGNHMYWFPDMPLNDLSFFSSPIETVTSALNPLIKMPMEIGPMQRKFFTGQPFTEELQEMPKHYGWVGITQALEAMGQVTKDKDGRPMADQRLIYALEQGWPMFARLQRWFPTDEAGKARAANTYLSNFLGVSVRTNDERSKANQIRRVISQLDEELTKQRGLGSDVRIAGYREISDTTRTVELNMDRLRYETDFLLTAANTFDADQLEEIPGVGETVARWIVLSRQQNGEYASLDDLMGLEQLSENKVNEILLSLADKPESMGLPSAKAIDINSGTADELEKIDGVGPTTAAKIIDFRTRFGPITSVWQLAEIDGVTRRQVEQIRAYYLDDEAKRASQEYQRYLRMGGGRPIEEVVTP